MNFLQFQAKPVSKVEATLSKVTASEYAIVPKEDLEAVKQLLDAGDRDDGTQMSPKERSIMESTIWTHIFDLLDVRETWRPTYQALILFGFLMDTTQCQKWISARQTGLNSRIEKLTAFTHTTDKRVQSLVRSEAAKVLSRLDALYSRWDREKENETMNAGHDDDLELQFPPRVKESAPNTASSIQLEERKQKEPDEEDSREDQLLLQILEEEEWPPPEWKDPQLQVKPTMIGLADSYSSSKELAPVGGFRSETLHRINAGRKDSMDSDDMILQTSGWRKTFRLWCCCLANFLRI